MAAYECNIPKVDKFLDGVWVWQDHKKKTYILTFHELAKRVNKNLINNDTYLYNKGWGRSNWYRLREIDGLKEAVREYLNSQRNRGKETHRRRVQKSKVADASTQGQKFTHAAERARSAESGRRHGRSETKGRVRSYSLSTESSRSARQRTKKRSKPSDHSRTRSTVNSHKKTSPSNNDRRARSPDRSQTKSVSRNVEREEQWKHHWRATQSISNLDTKQKMSKSNVESHISQRGQRGTQTQTLSTKTSVGSGSGLKSPRSLRKTFGPSIDERKMFEEPGRAHLRNDNWENRKDESSSDEEAKNQEGSLQQGQESRYSMSNPSRVLNKPIAKRHRGRGPSDTSTIVSNVSLTSTKRLSRLQPDIQDRRKMMMHRERLKEKKRKLELRKSKVEVKKQQLAKLRSEYTERAWGHKYIQVTEKKDLLLEQAELKAFKLRLEEELMNPSIFARSPVIAIKNAPGMLEKHEKLLSESVKDQQQLDQECVNISQELAKVCRAVKNIYSSQTDKNSERDRHDPLLGSLLLLEKENSKITRALQNSSSKLHCGDVTEEVVNEASVSGGNRKYLSPVPEVLNSSLHLNKFPSYDTGFTSEFEYENLCLDINSSDGSEEGEMLGTGRRFVVNLNDLAPTDCSPSPRVDQQRREYIDDRDYRGAHYREKRRKKPKSKPTREGRELGFPVQRAQTARVYRTQQSPYRCKTDRTQRNYHQKVEDRWYGEEGREDRQIRIHSQKQKPSPLTTFFASDISSDRERDWYVVPKKAKNYNWTLDYFAVDEPTLSSSPQPDARRLSPELARRSPRSGRDKSRERTSKSPKRGYRKLTPESQKSKQPYIRRGRSPQTNSRGRKMYNSPSQPKRKSKSPAKKLKRKIMEKRQRKQW